MYVHCHVLQFINSGGLRWTEYMLTMSGMQHLRPPKPKRPMGLRETFLLRLRPPGFWLSDAAS